MEKNISINGNISVKTDNWVIPNERIYAPLLLFDFMTIPLSFQSKIDARTEKNITSNRCSLVFDIDEYTGGIDIRNMGMQYIKYLYVHNSSISIDAEQSFLDKITYEYIKEIDLVNFYYKYFNDIYSSLENLEKTDFLISLKDKNAKFVNNIKIGNYKNAYNFFERIYNNYNSVQINSLIMNFPFELQKVNLTKIKILEDMSIEKETIFYDMDKDCFNENLLSIKDLGVVNKDELWFLEVWENFSDIFKKIDFTMNLTLKK